MKTLNTTQKFIAVTFITIFLLACLFARLEMFGFTSAQFSF